MATWQTHFLPTYILICVYTGGGEISSPLVLEAGAFSLGKELDDEKQGGSFACPNVSDGARL